MLRLAVLNHCDRLPEDGLGVGESSVLVEEGQLEGVGVRGLQRGEGEELRGKGKGAAGLERRQGEALCGQVLDVAKGLRVDEGSCEVFNSECLV